MDSEVIRIDALRQFEELHEDVHHGNERPSTSFEMADSKVHAEVVGGHGWGKTKIKVRADIEDVAAYLWNFGGRDNASATVDEEVKEVGRGGCFRKIVKKRLKVDSMHGGNHRDRLFVNEVTLIRVDKDTIVILKTPCEDNGGSKTARSR